MTKLCQAMDDDGGYFRLPTRKQRKANLKIETTVTALNNSISSEANDTTVMARWADLLNSVSAIYFNHM